MNWAAIIWAGLLVIFLIIEAACPFHLVSIWFAAGALCALLTGLLGGGLWLQVGVFLVVSCALLAMLLPLVRRVLNPGHTATNVDAVIGSTGVVTEAIDNLTATGQVKLDAMYWTARSTSGEPIAQGTRIRADRIEGVKVYVSPLEVPASV